MAEIVRQRETGRQAGRQRKTDRQSRQSRETERQGLGEGEW